LLNRTSVSHMVSMAATQAAISWSGAYRGYVAAIHERYKTWEQMYSTAYNAFPPLGAACPLCMANPLCPAVAKAHCKCLSAAQKWSKSQKDFAKAHDDKLLAKAWLALDKAAGMQTLALQGSA